MLPVSKDEKEREGFLKIGSRNYGSRGDHGYHLDSRPRLADGERETQRRRKKVNDLPKFTRLVKNCDLGAPG